MEARLQLGAWKTPWGNAQGRPAGMTRGGVRGADGTCVAHTHFHAERSVCEWGGQESGKRRHKVGPAWCRGQGQGVEVCRWEDPAGTEVQAEQYAAESTLGVGEGARRSPEAGPGLALPLAR